MKKQDLIQLHNLLSEVSEFCADDVAVELDEYLAQDTRPTSIHHAKGDHEAAVFALSDALTGAIADASVESVAADPVGAG